MKIVIILIMIKILNCICNWLGTTIQCQLSSSKLATLPQIAPVSMVVTVMMMMTTIATVTMMITVVTVMMIVIMKLLKVVEIQYFWNLNTLFLYFPISQGLVSWTKIAETPKITKDVFDIEFTKLHQAPKQHLNHTHLNCLKLDPLLALILMQQLSKHSFDCSN